MQAWREDTRAELRLKRKQRAFGGTFEHDAKAYLRSVASLPDINGRKAIVDLWIEVFGTTRRESITPVKIREWRDHWATQPRNGKDPRPLSHSTVNKRLRALSNIWTILDGRQSHNPVREVDELREAEPEPRALTYDHIKAIVAAMPDRSRAEKGKKRPTLSVTKIRLRCLAYCQIAPKQLAALTPADLNLAGHLLRLPRRMKGRGAKSIWVTLLPEAVAAFTDFDRHHLYGPFSQSSLRKSFKRAVKNAGVTVPGLRPYDLRHAYGALAFRALGGSLDGVGRLMQHTAKATTERYILAAEAQVIAELGARVAAQHLADQPSGSTPPGHTRNDWENEGRGPTTNDPIGKHAAVNTPSKTSMKPG